MILSVNRVLFDNWKLRRYFTVTIIEALIWQFYSHLHILLCFSKIHQSLGRFTISTSSYITVISSQLYTVCYRAIRFEIVSQAVLRWKTNQFLIQQPVLRMRIFIIWKINDILREWLSWCLTRSSSIHFACIGVAPPRLFTPQAKGIKNIHVLSWSYPSSSSWHQWGCVGNHATREKTPLM